MNNWKYLKGILYGFLLCCCFFGLATFWQLGSPTESSRWIDEVYTLKLNYANSISAPKLVILSGSNALYGVSCQSIQEETHVPCINAGTNAGLGINYILNRGHFFVKPGDVVLLPLEYELYQDTGIPNNVLIDYVLARDPKYLLSTDWVNKFQFIARVSFARLNQGIFAKLRPPNSSSSGYQSNTLNQYGDETNNQETNRSIEQFHYVIEAEPVEVKKPLNLEYGLSELSNFIGWCIQNNVRVLATWPNTVWFDVYQERKYQELFQQLRNFYKSFEVPILGQPKDFMYEPSMFFDSIYHLNERGTRRRTEHLINLLQTYLPV